MPRIKVTTLVAAFLWLALQSVTYAADQPNSYQLHSKRLQISYTTASVTGQPELTYTDRSRSLKFKGQEIRIVPSEIGQQVTVTLDQVPDLRTVTLTLLIPDINLVNPVVYFRTVGIVTTHATTIGGPGLVSGPVQTYRTLELHGQASRVDVPVVQPPLPPAANSAVTGQVILSPTCPGPQQPGQVCEGPYVGVTVQILDATGTVVATTTTDAQGAFSVPVVGGNYTVHIVTGAVLPSCPDTPAMAPNFEAASVVVTCDTGIR